jgi:hypothetical protein
MSVRPPSPHALHALIQGPTPAQCTRSAHEHTVSTRTRQGLRIQTRNRPLRQRRLKGRRGRATHAAVARTLQVTIPPKAQTVQPGAGRRARGERGECGGWGAVDPRGSRRMVGEWSRMGAGSASRPPPAGETERDRERRDRGGRDRERQRTWMDRVGM